MPKKSVDYSRTSIYKIQHEDNDELIYVGHTTDFTKRKCAHKQGSTNPNNKKHNYKVYKMIRDNGGWDCFRMIEIKKFPCNDANEATAEEDIIMQEMKATMNERRAYTGLTKYEYNKQYNIDNRDHTKEYIKQYYIDNADKIREQKREKYTCDCGVILCKDSSRRHNQTKKHLDLMMLK